MLVLTIVFGVLAVAFAIELVSLELRLIEAQSALSQHGIVAQRVVPGRVPKHAARVDELKAYDDWGIVPTEENWLISPGGA